MSRNPNEFVSEIISNIVSEMRQQKNGITRKLVPQLMGFKVDCWNDVTQVSPEFTQRILEQVPTDVLSQFEASLAKEVETYILNIPKTKLRTIVNKMMEQIIERTQDRIFDTMCNRYIEEMTQRVDAEIKSKYSAWFVAQQLNDVNS